MKFELITAEIGSTTTIVTVFEGIGTKKPKKITQAEHFTTVNEGDVTLGINQCLDDIRKKVKADFDWDE
ncbi:MAG TPA: glutamate mutase L, partial [Thermotogota bacterium]|nr:glutamate mutase L [Thermotogota bacterium]HRW34705.1 glutamate mutase L [Thermotogota bacterium]